MDRLTVSDDKTLKSRLADSAETAFFEGHGTCLIRIYTEEGVVVKEFSKEVRGGWHDIRGAYRYDV